MTEQTAATIRDSLAPGVRTRIIELGRLVRERRSSAGLSLRGAASEIGTAFVTLGTLENGVPCDLINTLAVLRWMDLPADWLYGDNPAQSVDAYRRGRDDLASQIRVLLDKESSGDSDA